RFGGFECLGDREVVGDEIERGTELEPQQLDDGSKEPTERAARVVLGEVVGREVATAGGAQGERIAEGERGRGGAGRRGGQVRVVAGTDEQRDGRETL